jgi:hypothetical protein
MDDGEHYDRPCGELVESEVIVERNEVVERGATEEGDEVAADGEEYEDDIDVKDKSSSAGDDCSGNTQKPNGPEKKNLP